MNPVPDYECCKRIGQSAEVGHQNDVQAGKFGCRLTEPEMAAAMTSCFPFPGKVVLSGLKRRGDPKIPPVQKSSKLLVPASFPPLVLRRGFE